MYDLVVEKINECYLKIECEKAISQELYSYFSFRVPGFQFVPAYKNKLWDGFIRLYSIRDNTLYCGLLSYIKVFCNERNYSLKIDPKLSITHEFSITEANQFIEQLGVPFEKRDYQLDAFVNSIRNKKQLILSPTASGKSFIIYLIVRKIQELNFKKGLLIVPTTSLCHQMFTDFESYGYDSEKYCHIIYSGKEKQSDKFFFISTWQSLYKLPPEYFEQFDFVIGDECHLFKAKSLTYIMTNLINAEYRIGCTGTLDGSHTNKLVLEGLFGNVFKSTTTKELMDKNLLSNFTIKCLTLKHDENVCQRLKSEKWDYQKEIEYIVLNNQRNNFIKNLVLSLKGNSLILFQFVEKHGKILYDMINKESGTKKIFFIYGKTDVEIRESVRTIMENEKDCIIVASTQIFSTGINIKNLHNIIFSSPSKSRIRTLQSIGRVLRKSENKEIATLYDISDDLRSGKHINFTLKHFISRLKLYDEEKFNYKLYNIQLK
jgi:superfamily II DNA or RNA helicase